MYIIEIENLSIIINKYIYMLLDTSIVLLIILISMYVLTCFN